MFTLTASVSADEKASEGNVILTKNGIIRHINQVPLPLITVNLSLTAFISRYEWGALWTTAPLPWQTWQCCLLMHCVLHLRHEGCWVSLFHSRTQKQRRYSSHFSSFLGFSWCLLTLSLLCLINGTVFLVAVVIKSNEFSNGWGFVESAVGNWEGGCLRWGSVSVLSPHGNEIVFHFSLRRS